MTALFLNQYLNFKESSPLHKPPHHIILSTTEINIIISNKNHPASISLLLSRVEALVTPSHDNLNLLLCRNLNTSSFHSFNSCLRSLKLNILFFTSIHKLHLSLIAVSTVTRNWLKSQNGTLFSHVWRRGRLALDPLRNKSCSEFFSQAYKNWHITWGNNLGPDWPPLARGSKFHTITHPPGRFLPSPRQWKIMSL